MADPDRTVNVVLSLLRDVIEERRQLRAEENVYTRERVVQDILKGDLAVAHRELDKLATAGLDASATRALVFFEEGALWMRVPPGTTDRGFALRCYDRAIDALTKAIECNAGAEAYYNLGLALAARGRKEEALEALRQAEGSGDEELSVSAAKQIARLTQQKGGCFIATACYGGYAHPQVLLFRRFRDHTLLQSAAGRSVVWLYYRVSPFLARTLRRCPWAAGWVRWAILEPLSFCVRKLDAR